MDSVLCFLVTRSAALSLTSLFLLDYVASWTLGGTVHRDWNEKQEGFCNLDLGNIKAFPQNL